MGTKDETCRATCHCGAVTISALLPDGLASASRCDCSFCLRRGAAAVTARTDSLRILQGEENLTLYTWGSHTAQHYFCKTCGIYMYHQRRSDPRQCGINLACIDGGNPRHHARTHGEIPWSDGVNHPSDRTTAT
ncbi:GFA family protein [Tritonibacter horizontis]|uniref:Glutathione-dependent formaldehyde-activating enzyme n=1 Tax=Tritonibacter horizontis TaxID=1768241 RepID=A0A132BTC5_9RHOB|nr:GFA family protein [Tritonibacter horizontis]KUP91282.1 glutathione-dependent formaldehyde-activating enzyme [Tritonibacter horizontis]